MSSPKRMDLLRLRGTHSLLDSSPRAKLHQHGQPVVTASMDNATMSTVSSAVRMLSSMAREDLITVAHRIP
ncbi:hypothetical protein [Streptomyces sp. NPDC050392]|uniref:hypothetical protein n=1 Tax=Streptomyces sp. NPDC050392 TaxID=3155782 RepID=UPI00342B7DAC